MTGSGSAFVFFGFGRASLSYPPLTGVQGRPLRPLAPVFRVGAGQASFSVSPSLPAGLSLDRTTGVVSGTPTVAANATYTVSLTDLTGTITAPLRISIAAPAATPPATTLTILSARLTRTRFHAAARGAAKPIGTSFRITLSAPATLTITLTRKRPRLSLGSIQRANAPKGLTTIPFNGRLAGRPLKPGAYIATITASNAQRTARPTTLTFTILAH